MEERHRDAANRPLTSGALPDYNGVAWDDGVGVGRIARVGIVVMSSLIVWLLILTGVVVTVTDQRYHRIPNVVTLPMIVVGWVANALPEEYGVGACDWKVGVYGSLLGFGILFAPFALNVVKAGDVKYLAGVGALGGPMVALFTFLYGSLAHGLVCLIVLARRGETAAAFENIGFYFRNSLLARRVVDFSSRSQGQAPYALGLVVGLFATLAFVWRTGAVFPLWA